MTEFPGLWQSWALSWALTYLLHSTVLIGAAWVVIRLPWFRAPRSREVLWTAAFLGGVVTSTAAKLDVVQWGEQHMEVEVQVAQVVGAPPAGDVRMERLHWQSDDAEAMGPMPLRIDGPASLWGGDARAGALTPVPGSAPGPACRAALLVVWLLGAMLFGAREVQRYVALLRIRTSTGPAAARVEAALERLSRDLEPRSARVRVSDRVDTPCVVDARTIVLPPRCHDELGDAELRAVLAHEAAHIGRHDVRWQSLFRWTAVLLWFQPLNRPVLRRLSDVAELICDDWAVQRIRSPLDLARSISRVAEWSIPVSRREAVLVGSQGGRISDRVRRILGRPGRSQLGGRRRALVAAAALVALLTQLPTVSLSNEFQRVLFMDQAVFLQTVDASANSFEVEGSGVEPVERMLVRVRRMDALP